MGNFVDQMVEDKKVKSWKPGTWPWLAVGGSAQQGQKQGQRGQPRSLQRRPSPSTVKLHHQRPGRVSQNLLRRFPAVLLCLLFSPNQERVHWSAPAQCQLCHFLSPRMASWSESWEGSLVITDPVVGFAMAPQSPSEQRPSPGPTILCHPWPIQLPWNSERL